MMVHVSKIKIYIVVSENNIIVHDNDTVTRRSGRITIFNPSKPGPQSRTLWSTVCVLDIAISILTNWSMVSLYIAILCH